MQWRIRSCRDDACGHYVRYFPGVCLDVFGCKRVISDQAQEPPRVPSLCARFGAMQQIALADNTNELALIIDNGNGANLMLQERLRNLFYRRGWPYRDHRRNHYIAGFHRRLRTQLAIMVRLNATTQDAFNT